MSFFFSAVPLLIYTFPFSAYRRLPFWSPYFHGVLVRFDPRILLYKSLCGTPYNPLGKDIWRFTIFLDTIPTTMPPIVTVVFLRHKATHDTKVLLRL